MQTADPQTAGCMCGLELSDPQTDRVMTERVCVSCLQEVCLRLKDNLVLSSVDTTVRRLSLLASALRRVFPVDIFHSKVQSRAVIGCSFVTCAMTNVN